MLTAKRVKEILAVPYTHKIFVSLDGGNARSHDLNRGQGNFHKTMGGLRRLLAMLSDDRRFATIGVYQIDLNQTEEAYDPEFEIGRATFELQLLMCISFPVFVSNKKPKYLSKILMLTSVIPHSNTP